MLTIEIFKSLKYSDLMNDVFQVKSPVPYYLRDKNEFYSRNPKTVTYGLIQSRMNGKTHFLRNGKTINLYILSKKV